MFDGSDYALVWPPALVGTELEPLLADWAGQVHWERRAVLVLREAFAGDRPASELIDAGRDEMSGLLDEGRGRPEQRTYLSELVRSLDTLSLANPPQPLWSQRRGARSEPERLGWPEVAAIFARMVHEFAEAGYLNKALPHARQRGHLSTTRTNLLLQELTGLFGTDGVWPLDTDGVWPLPATHASWSREQLLDLIEAFHDLVARPRLRLESEQRAQCRYDDFAVEPGRRLYRWRVNRLLDQSDLICRLAEEGEDVGRLVARTDEARMELVSRAVARTDDTTGDQVRHALVLFRARGATEHDKRSAIVTLAGVLEERRELIKTELFRKDEGALFQIANEFALRHRNQGQKSDYDVAFLDWVFWWYLATIDLIGSLLARQRHATSS